MKMLRQENVMQVVDHWETSDDMYLVVENIEVCNYAFIVTQVPLPPPPPPPPNTSKAVVELKFKFLIA